MIKIMMFSASHPRSVLSMMGLITLVAMLQLNDLQINISAESMLIKGTPAWDSFQRVQDTFGSVPEFTPQKTRQEWRVFVRSR